MIAVWCCVAFLSETALDQESPGSIPGGAMRRLAKAGRFSLYGSLRLGCGVPSLRSGPASPTSSGLRPSSVRSQEGQ